MPKLEIKLKQHTPLIHFQHDQEGATLRASEVKPRLDKYIITQLGEGDYEKGKAKAKANGWLVGKGEHPALDYKMRIEAPKDKIWDMKYDTGKKNNKTGKNIIWSMPLFFGNMKSESPKKMVYNEGEITMEVFSLHSELCIHVEKYLDDFLFMTNFGTRQSKGFGSFSRKGVNYNNSNGKGGSYRIRIKARGESGSWTDFYNLFQNIDLFYKTLRSGINQKPFYFKSMMYHYAKSKYRKEYWDKRAIRTHFELFTDTERKEELFKEDMPQKGELDKGENKDWSVDGEKGTTKEDAKLYREILGLSTSQEWMKYGATITKSNPEIDRFKSPILIKPVYDNQSKEYLVFIIPLPIEKSYSNAVMTINVEYKNKVPDRLDQKKKEELKNRMEKREKRENSPMTLSIPSGFEVADYLKYVFEGDGKDIVLAQINKMPDDSDKSGNKKETIKEKLKKIYNIL